MQSSDPLVHQIATESKAVLSQWELNLGNLITIQLPEHLSPDRQGELIQELGEWWITKAPYFRGAKLIILQPGVVLGVHTDDSLIQLGYIRIKNAGAVLDDSFGAASDFLEERGFNTAATALRHLVGVPV